MRLQHSPIFSLARNLAEEGGYYPNFAFAFSYMLLPFVLWRVGVVQKALKMYVVAFILMFGALFFHDLPHVLLNVIGVVLSTVATIVAGKALERRKPLYVVLSGTAVVGLIMVFVIARGPWEGDVAYYNYPFFCIVEYLDTFLASLAVFIVCIEDKTVDSFRLQARQEQRERGNVRGPAATPLRPFP